MPVPVDHFCRGHVLAVDDCAVTREILRASLESLGYRVEAVGSGWAALEAVGQATYDAVVLDVEMPGLDGTAVGRALRDDPKTAQTMIAMHSSVEEAAVRLRFNQYDAFVPKADSPMALGERLDRMMRGRRR